MLSQKKKIVLVILIAVALNFVSFCVAYPQTFKPESSVWARDFSAYYIGEWRLLHNPAEIYAGGSQRGDCKILPCPQTFKYSPSFLLLFAPFLSLSYQNAFTAFDLLQLALIPALAFFVYKFVKEKNLIVGAVAAAVILIEPLPSPTINFSASSVLSGRMFSLNSQSLAPSYYCGYVLANAHVLQTVLLVGALYFGFTKKPWLSALLFAFGAFDPRAALIALPLMLWFNRQKIRTFLAASTGLILATNVPFFFYHGIGFAFFQAELNGNTISQMWPYDWISVYAVAALTIIEFVTILSRNLKKPANFFHTERDRN